ncbi:ABC1 kinase family protein [Brumimicrobium aurantiacum]|uniref:AarF/ABC1/UbiB kinase family protein n=1 Tax=Brumimicrobium aurantiacum TaxID=1737063 RepID=A0A3E1EV11_9FLAO|nr:AarF/UbiB family protein [Brumimicrobium aurantiacum]RFC53404.1 AarF/ABC1/UbiB kinase family protein [Brumimicrobium aurantiacum]
MGILPDQYDKYVRFFKFMLKYWNSDVFSFPSDEIQALDKENIASEFDHTPEELTEDLKKMGPTYVKLGQLLSTRPDLLPPHFMDSLATLQDDVDEVKYEEVEEIFKEEIGVRISKAFQFFDPNPMASASIGQVHKAIMHSGEVVAVKIQRPGIRKRFIEDLDTLLDISEKAEKLSEVARSFGAHNVIEELRYVLLKELDYNLEAQNLITLKANLAEIKNISIPTPFADYSSSKVLTMEFVEGVKVTKVSPLKLMDLDLTPLVDDLIKSYLKQIIIDGIAHADPHPGNVYLTKDNKIALMDAGMVAKFSKEMQETVLKLMIGLSNYDSAKVTEILLSISQYDENDVDLAQFKKNIVRKIQESENQKAKDLQSGRTLIEINQIAAKQNIHIPVDLNVLGKILLNLDQIVAFLTPEYDMQSTMKRYIHKLMQKKMKADLKPANFMELFLEMKDLTENLPSRLNKFTSNLAENEVKVKVDAFDEDRFTGAFQKVANRITAGVIIAALIIGAAMLVQIPSPYTVFGYPTFAFILFVLAALIAMYLLYQILFIDGRNKK